jgi:hypothetical protein
MINPTNAVKTASDITRGFMSARKSGKRVIALDREGDCRRATRIAVIAIGQTLSAPQTGFREIDDLIAAAADHGLM